MTTATKCIAVKTPFGNMYLKLGFDGVTYELSTDEKTQSIYFEYVKHTASNLVYFETYNASFVEIKDTLSDVPMGFLSIVSNYGDQFPQ